MEFIVFITIKKTIFYLVLVYGIFGFVLFPLLVKPQIIKIITQETHAKIEVGNIYFNPFLLKLKLSDVRLYNQKNQELVSFQELFVDLEFYSLARLALHIHEMTLVNPKINLVYYADKSFNLLNILKEQEQAIEDDNSSLELPRIIVDAVSIQGGELFYKDYSVKTPFSFSFSKIGFELKDLDTQESKEKDAKVRFYATLGDGGFIDFKSTIESLTPFKTAGSLDFQASKLYTEWQYVRDMINLEVADGKIFLHTNYQFNLDDMNATKLDNLALKVQKFRVKPKSKSKDILKIENFSINNSTIEPFKQSVKIEKIDLDGLSASAERMSNGDLDWLEYLKISTDSNTTTPKPLESEESVVPSLPWNLLIKDLSLKKIALSFEDKMILPSVKTQVDELNISAKDVSLSGEKPFEYSMEMRINDKTHCSSQGNVAHKNLNLQAFVACEDFDVTHYNPYIETEAKKALYSYNIFLKSFLANVNADIYLKESNTTYPLVITNANIALKNFQLNKKGSKKELLKFKDFLVKGISIDTDAKSVNVENVLCDTLVAKLEKLKNGSFNVENLIEAKKSDNMTLEKEEKPYSVHLKHFGMNNASVEFRDNSLTHRATNKIVAINANVYDVDLKKNSWLKYDLAMKVNSKGSVKAKGKLRHTPLKQSGSFDIQNLSLIELTPYLQESAYVSIEDGKLSLKGKTEYAKSSRTPDLRIEGSVALKSFFVNETLHNTQLLSLSDVKVNAYTFELNPNRVHVDEVDVSSFYVDAKLDENKTLNFSELIKRSDENNSLAVTQADSKESTPSFPYRILKVNVALGSARFADYSIPIKFSTYIHNLNGAIYAISNTLGDTTYVDIDGEVDKYASTSLKGSIDSSNPKAYTDLDFNFKNLNLKSFSGYSASFAGHEIDAGKLYLDLGYKILDSQLLGSNSVVIKRMKLGKEMHDANTTVLPLGFVIGLLEDADGVMDIDMPVEGNLDEPDFKYGRVVLKAFGNLIAKAVTSPFKFLSSAMGIAGENLEYIAYEPGSSEISPPQREKLDKIAKMMLKKPKILLSFSGKYELEKDKEALQLQKLIELVVKKSGVKNIKDHKSSISTDLLEEIYEETSDDNGLDKLQERVHLAYKDRAAYERTYHNELLILCREAQVIPKSKLIDLADARAEKIMNYLVKEKLLNAQRISKKTSQIKEDDDTDIIKIDMEIKVK